MKRFIIPFICFVFIFAVFNYNSEVNVAKEQITVVDNYSIVFDSNSNLGKLKFNMYLNSMDKDVEMTIYNPNNEIVMKETIVAGTPIEEVFYLNAQKGNWLIDFAVDKTDFTYQIQFVEMYLSGIKEQSFLTYFLLLATSTIIFSIILILIKQIFRIEKLKNSAELRHDDIGSMEKCNKLKTTCFAKRIKSVYIMNIAEGYKYKGDYLKAREVLDSIPFDKRGEVVISKPWLKLFYINYISILLEFNEVDEAEKIFNDKKTILNRKTFNKNDIYLTSYIETVILIHKGDYLNSIDRLLAIQSLIEKDEDIAETNYLLSKSYYELKNITKAKEYLSRSKEIVNYNGLSIKISDLENQIENVGIIYEV